MQSVELASGFFKGPELWYASDRALSLETYVGYAGYQEQSRDVLYPLSFPAYKIFYGEYKAGALKQFIPGFPFSL